MRERSNLEDTAHLEYQEHPADAEADQGAPNEAVRPEQTDLHDSHHKGRWVSKGLEA